MGRVGHGVGLRVSCSDLCVCRWSCCLGRLFDGGCAVSVLHLGMQGSIFEQVFGGGQFARGDRPRRRVLHAALNISFEEAVKGAKKVVNLASLGISGVGTKPVEIAIPAGKELWGGQLFWSAGLMPVRCLPARWAGGPWAGKAASQPAGVLSAA